MSLRDRLEPIAAAMPSDGSVTLPVAVLRAWMAEEATADPLPPPVVVADHGEHDWRTRLWTCPADTRMGVKQVASALDRSADYVYRATNAKRAKEKGREPLPCSRLDGELVFVASAVRDWLKRSEQIVQPRPRLSA